MEAVKNKKICRKCLLREIDELAYFENLRQYIENLEEEAKVDNATYETRLQVCKACDLLAEGMCRACGCFVELRGVMKKNNCPYGRW